MGRSLKKQAGILVLCVAPALVLGALGGGEASLIPSHSFEQRHACKHYQAIGCITDIMERTCEDEIDFLAKSAEDSVHLCACPEPFAACTRSKRQDTLAHQLLETHITPLGEDVKDKEVILKALQDVRTGLWEDDDTCRSVFANPKPYTGCINRTVYTDKNSEPSHSNTERGSIERLDMFCELRTWQYEELGSSALAELELNKCPKDGLKRPPKEQTLRRLSQTLTKDEL